jgi:dihydrofolate reductase
MAKLIYGLNQSLDGYVDHDRFGPDAVLFRHFIEHMTRVTGSLYGGRMYEIMRYWDEDQPGWDDAERDYARAWRGTPKWVASRSHTSVGPNATLLKGNLETAIRTLKAEQDGEIEVAGPALAAILMPMGLIDAYQIYLHPVVLGDGTPFLKDARPPLRLVENQPIGESVVRLTYVPA